MFWRFLFRLLPVLFLLLGTNSWAQRLARPGYLVTVAGDSLSGTIWLEDRAAMSEEIRFSPNSASFNDARLFTVSDIRVYGYGPTRYERVSVPVLDENEVVRPGQREWRLLRRDETGKLDCFALEEDRRTRTFLYDGTTWYNLDLRRSEALARVGQADRLTLPVSGQRSEVIVRSTTGDGLIRSEESGRIFLVANDTLYRITDHRLGTIRSLVADCPEVDLSRVSDPVTHALVRSLVRQYNNCRMQQGVSRRSQADWQPALLPGGGYNRLLQQGFSRPFFPSLAVEIRRNDWSPRISLRYAIGYTRGEPTALLDPGGVAPPESHVIIQDFAVQYHLRPGRNWRPYFGLGLVRYDLRAVRPEGVPLTIDQLQDVRGNFPLFAAGMDWYWLPHWQFRVFIESRGGFASGLRIGWWW